MTKVTAIAPTRIDIAGGTLDIWPLNLFFKNSVTVNMAISIEVMAQVKLRRDKIIVLKSEDQKETAKFSSYEKINHDHKLGLLSRVAEHFLDGNTGVTITTRSNAPAGAGLAGSSALNIALIYAMARATDKKVSKAQSIEIAKDIEASLLKVPTGLQDYAAAVYGGVSALSFPPGGMQKKRIKGKERWLEDRLVLFYSGKQRNSGINNWEIFKRVIDGDKNIHAGLATIADCANNVYNAIVMENEKDFIEAVNDEWVARKNLFPQISTPSIDRAIKAGIKAGAKGARICGAGGGGCFFIIAEPGTVKTVTNAVEKCGAKKLPYSVSKQGVKVHSA